MASKEKKGRKFGRQLNSPSHKAYNAEGRMLRNKRRKMVMAFIATKKRDENLANNFRRLFGSDIEKYV